MLILLLMPAWVPGQREPLGLHLVEVFSECPCLDESKRIVKEDQSKWSEQAATNRQLLVSVVDMYPAVSFSYHPRLSTNSTEI